MSIKDLQKDIRKHGGYILSDGTCNYCHLLPRAYDLILGYAIHAGRVTASIREVFNAKRPTFTAQYYNAISVKDEDLASYVWNEDIFNLFNNIAPNGYYFGSSEGDGARIGWFKIGNED